MADDDLARLVSDGLAEIRAAVAEMRVIYDAQNRRLDRLETEIWGDGRAGLAVQVRAILWIATGCLGFLVVVLGHLVYHWVGS